MIYLGLDLSLQNTGWCRYYAENGAKDSGVFSVRKGSCDLLRLAEYRYLINELLLQVEPDLVAVEGYAMMAKGRSFSIGEQGGVIRLLLWEMGIPTIVVPPSNLKQFATGKGNAVKGSVMVSCLSRWGETFDDDNEADAYALSRIAEVYHKNEYTGLPDFQVKSLEKVEVLIKKNRPRTRFRTRSMG